MSRRHHDPTHKAEIERFFTRLDRYVERHSGHFGKPARIYTDNSIEFRSVTYLTAIEEAIEIQYKIPRKGKDDAP
jgi:hypothetical protein